MCVWLKQLKINRLLKKIKSMQQHRLHNQPTTEVLLKEQAAYHKLANIYAKLRYKKKWPFAHISQLAAYRASAMLDDSASQYVLGEYLLNEARFRERMQQEGTLASDSNAAQIQLLYRDAHAFLLAAETLHHIQAKRLHGLCYIEGWGVPVDRDRGFELVVQSIEQENSWDKIPQIFKEIGLNKPEFFSALTKRRYKGT